MGAQALRLVKIQKTVHSLLPGCGWDLSWDKHRIKGRISNFYMLCVCVCVKMWRFGDCSLSLCCLLSCNGHNPVSWSLPIILPTLFMSTSDWTNAATLHWAKTPAVANQAWDTVNGTGRSRAKGHLLDDVRRHLRCCTSPSLSYSSVAACRCTVSGCYTLQHPVRRSTASLEFSPRGCGDSFIFMP